MNLIKNVNIVKASTIRFAAASTIVSKRVDMAGYEGVVFIAVGSSLLAATTGSTAGNTKTQLHVSGTSSTAGTWNRYSGFAASSSGLAAAAGTKRLLVLDLYRPLDRYVRALVKGSSAANYIDAILAIQYGAKRAGSTALMRSTMVAGSTVLASPTT